MTSPTTARDLGKAFFEAVITVTSYVIDETLRNKLLYELVETNKLLRKSTESKIRRLDEGEIPVEARH